MKIFKLKHVAAAIVFVFIFCFESYSQVYLHNFGTTTITAYPYNVAPGTFDPNLSNSSWTSSTGTLTSYAGSSGQALSLSNSGGTPTLTLTFDVGAGCTLDITSFNFWRRRSSTGAQNWSMTINGISVGSGTVPTTGSAIGVTPVASPVTGLSGTVTVVISLSGASGAGTFRIDDFELIGSTSCGPVTPTQLTHTVTPGCADNGATFSITVCATDASEVVDNTYTDNITVSIASGPGGATLGGTLTQAAVAGCATFSDLTLDVNGDYTLNASDGSLTDGVTNTISIATSCDACIEIESILVDACNANSGTEGENEMVHFTTNVSINTSSISVDWPNNSDLGICQDATTATIVSNINSTITGGGTVLEPTGGVIPAGAEVILVTSTDFDYLNHDWSALNYDVYMIFQCAGNTSGHFANYSATSGVRELILDVGACADTVQYDRSLLDGTGDGDAVEFAPDGTPTYGNNGCEPPLFPLPILNINLKVNKIENGVVLEWSSLIYNESGYYSVLKSKDGYIFEELNKLEHNETTTKYKYVDNFMSTNIAYYKIVFVSETNEKVSSKVKKIESDERLINNIYPNPASDNLTVLMQSSTNAVLTTVIVKDITGREILNQSFDAAKGENRLDINTLEFISGTYVLTVLNSTGSDNRMFIVK